MIFDCKDCTHSRIGVSENGYHTICCLSSKAAMECITGKKCRFERGYIFDCCERKDGADNELLGNERTNARN